MKINNKIPWGLATGTLGVTIVGTFDGTMMLGMTSVIAGALALVMALLTKQPNRENEIKTRITIRTQIGRLLSSSLIF
jgi:hypothetical protein